MALARVVKDVFIVAAKRTPFGTYGGKLMKLTTTDLQEIAARAALESGKINPEWVNSVIIGNVQQSSADGCYLPRHVALRVGIPHIASAYAVNRMCGSGFQSIVSAAQEIECGISDVVLTGGTENMSLTPHSARGIRFGMTLGVSPVLEDTLWMSFTDQHINTPLGITAENLAQKYNISREQCDEFAVRSNQLWRNAYDNGYLDEEMAPVTIKSKKGDVVVDTDEHPRPQTTLQQMAKLRPSFKKGGTVHAGNASGICDGAGSVIVASEAAVTKYNITPLARVIGYSIAGCDPAIMGIGPVPAIKALLSKTNMELKNIDLIEINEAFAPQVLACQKELDIDLDKLNTNGGAIAMGHPVGASGARITAHLTYKMRREGVKHAICSACVGGGQGIALLLENID